MVRKATKKTRSRRRDNKARRAVQRPDVLPPMFPPVMVGGKYHLGPCDEYGRE